MKIAPTKMKALTLRLVVSVLVGGLLLGCSQSKKVPTDTKRVDSNTGFTLGIYDINMMDQSFGWALSDKGLLRTADGAVTWKDVTPKGISKITKDISGFFMNITTAWILEQRATDSGTLYRTSDGGDTWQSTEVPFGSAHLTFTSGQNQSNGWALKTGSVSMGSSSSEVFSTHDSGRSWVRVSHGEDPNDGGRDSNRLPLAGIKEGITFRSDERVGWVTTEQRSLNVVGLYRTEDGGKTWSQQALPIPQGLQDHSLTILAPKFFSSNDGILPVRFNGSNRAYVVYVTHDGGNSWGDSKPLPYRDARLLISFANAKTGWAVEESTSEAAKLFVTRDGGNTWAQVDSHTILVGVTDVDFITPELGWIIARIEGQRAVLRTRDGGTTWEVMNQQ